MSDSRNKPFADKDAVAAFYAGLQEEHGDDPGAVGWESPHTQVASFFQIIAADGFRPGVSVLDVGCGLGHFKSFLDDQGIEVAYTGWDITEPLITRARELHPESHFEVRDLLKDPGSQTFDFVVCSGALTSRLLDHEAWVAEMIRAMFGLCRRALVFNLLSGHYAHDHPFEVIHERYYHAQPERIMGFCFELTRQVSLDHSSLANSFAVYLYRSNTRAIDQLVAHLQPGREFGPAQMPIIEYYESFDMFEELIGYLESLEPSAALHDRIGVTAFQLQDHERMVSAFEKAAELDPEWAQPLFRLAIVDMEEGEHARAAERLERARALEPENPDFPFRLGLCFERLERLSRARAMYDATLALDPENQNALEALQRLGD